jgi:hypothetical protein
VEYLQTNLAVKKVGDLEYHQEWLALLEGLAGKGREEDPLLTLRVEVINQLPQLEVALVLTNLAFVVARC